MTCEEWGAYAELECYLADRRWTAQYNLPSNTSNSGAVLVDDSLYFSSGGTFTQTLRPTNGTANCAPPNEIVWTGTYVQTKTTPSTLQLTYSACNANAAGCLNCSVVAPGGSNSTTVIVVEVLFAEGCAQFSWTDDSDIAATAAHTAATRAYTFASATATDAGWMLYASGQLTPLGSWAALNATAWQSLPGPELTRTIYAVVEVGGAIYAGGDFGRIRVDACGHGRGRHGVRAVRVSERAHCGRQLFRRRHRLCQQGRTLERHAF